MKAAKARVIVAGIPDACDRDEPRAVGFFQVPAAFMADLPLAELSTMKVYFALCANANNENKQTFISVQTIAKQIGMSRRIVQHALRWLEAKRWIKPKTRRGEVTRYQIWFHPEIMGRNPLRGRTEERTLSGSPTLNSNSEEGPAPWDEL
jgi:hypothetical protein